MFGFNLIPRLSKHQSSQFPLIRRISLLYERSKLVSALVYYLIKLFYEKCTLVQRVVRLAETYYSQCESTGANQNEFHDAENIEGRASQGS
jgi:hypothetical protein